MGKEILIGTLGSDGKLKSEARGGYLLRYTKARCVISEPFFIDNDSDLVRTTEDLEGFAAAYATAIDKIAQVVSVS